MDEFIILSLKLSTSQPVKNEIILHQIEKETNFYGKISPQFSTLIKMNKYLFHINREFVVESLV